MSQNYKILIVDDAIFVHKVILKHLENNAHLLSFYNASENTLNCDDAKDGKEALDLVSKNNYDLITLDLNMPGIDGIEVAKEVLKNNPDQKILIITALKNEFNKETFEKIGLNYYLFKPFSEEQLINAIIEINR